MQAVLITSHKAAQRLPISGVAPGLRTIRKLDCTVSDNLPTSGFKPAKVLFYVVDVRDSEADKHALVFSFRSNLSYLRPPWSSHSAGSRSGGPSSAKKRL